VKYFGGPRAWDYLGVSQHLLCGFLAEGTSFALDSYFHLLGKVAWVGGFVQILGVHRGELFIAEFAENGRGGR